MKDKLLILFTALVLMLSIVGCKNTRAGHEEIISQWIGREIMFPDELVYRIQDDTVDLDLNMADFKIVNYVDSTGCTSCRMKLDLWTNFINEVKSMTDLDIEIITVVNSIETEKISEILRLKNYLNPVVIDSDNRFERTNSLPSKSEHQCFLLDNENRVVAIGNPVLNPKIKEIYMQCIAETLNELSDSQKHGRPAKALGVFSRGQAKTQVFYLNPGDSVQYTIQAIVPSCDCVKARVETQAEAGVIKIAVTYTADSVIGAFSRYVDVFFNEKDTCERLTVYGYVKK